MVMIHTYYLQTVGMELRDEWYVSDHSGEYMSGLSATRSI